MSGFQFVHVEVYSRKGAPGVPGKDGVVRGGKASVDAVLGEAARDPGQALHVEAPSLPVLIHGLDVAGVRRLHDESVEVARAEVKGGKSRKVRQDQGTLFTVIASYPATVAECLEDPVKARARDEWQARNVAWLRSMYGDQVVGVVRHDDEKHPHLHAFVLPSNPSMQANQLHPGWTAKQAAKVEAAADGLAGKDANKAADRAYREAMRGLQDSYWEAVGLPSGLARVGPARRRLSRDAWQAEQASVGHAAVAIQAAVKAEEAASVAVEGRRVAEERAASLKDRGVAFVTRAREEAARAKAAADAAEERRDVAFKAEEAARRSAAEIVRAARRDAAGMLADAERRADRLRHLGQLVGVAWAGLSGVRRRIEESADRRVAEARAMASKGIQGALESARSEVGGDLVVARREAAEAAQRVAAAERKLAEVERDLGRERGRRQVAEREREDFRGRWADADNRLIELARVHGR